jgi:hypothetical protein
MDSRDLQNIFVLPSDELEVRWMGSGRYERHFYNTAAVIEFDEPDQDYAPREHFQSRVPICTEHRAFPVNFTCQKYTTSSDTDICQ